MILFSLNIFAIKLNFLIGGVVSRFYMFIVISFLKLLCILKDFFIDRHLLSKLGY